MGLVGNKRLSLFSLRYGVRVKLYHLHGTGSECYPKHERPTSPCPDHNLILLAAPIREALSSDCDGQISERTRLDSQWGRPDTFYLPSVHRILDYFSWLRTSIFKG